MASRAARAPSKPVIVQLQPDSLVLLWQPASDTAGGHGYRIELRRGVPDPHGLEKEEFGPGEVAVPDSRSLHPACH